MITIKKIFGHLRTILIHKYWVLHYMSGVGFFWRGLIHDMSKFSPEEFFESVRYWTGVRSPIVVAKEYAGISYAWLHHKGRNKHHYEYWIDKLDQGGIPYKIPYKYVIEMVCDWFAAARSYGNVDAEEVYAKEYDWWCAKNKTVKIRKSTKDMIDKILWNFREYYKSYLCTAKKDGSKNPHKVAEKKTLSVIKMFINGWKHEYESE